MNSVARKPRSKHPLRRWFARSQDDFFFLLGCGLILFGTWRTWPVAIWFVAGGMCIVWGVLVALGGRK
jgi:hypothetical protein